MTDPHNLRLLIADDEPSVRSLLKTILTVDGFRVLGEVADGSEAVRVCEDIVPNFAVLDISMPLLNGIDAARSILQGNSRIKIILVTVHREVCYLLEGLRAGIAGYLTKDKLASCLTEAIAAVGTGETYVRVGSLGND